MLLPLNNNIQLILQVDKLRILSESLANSTLKAEKRIVDQRFNILLMPIYVLHVFLHCCFCVCCSYKGSMCNMSFLWHYFLIWYKLPLLMKERKMWGQEILFQGQGVKTLLALSNITKHNSYKIIYYESTKEWPNLSRFSLKTSFFL